MGYLQLHGDKCEAAKFKKILVPNYAAIDWLLWKNQDLHYVNDCIIIR